ncbi:hypothetical protein [Crocinitomix catalasitica]|uniref:hypothetical protein n=1 Tax=Crocinitomix catalasitica TaxID=184607 RepID=UPI0004888E79|nr:hypothetical protein [Crocinitomix catalasitica]
MFGLDDLMSKVDLGDILEKVGLSDNDKQEVTKQAVEAVKYRTTKEKARGNDSTMSNLFSSNDNTTEANNVSKKLEGDLAFNLKNKTGLSEGIIDQIKSVVMSKVMSGFSNSAAEKGDKEGNGLMDMFTDSDMLSKFTSGDTMDAIKGKLGGLFK